MKGNLYFLEKDLASLYMYVIRDVISLSVQRFFLCEPFTILKNNHNLYNNIWYITNYIMICDYFENFNLLFFKIDHNHLLKLNKSKGIHIVISIMQTHVDQDQYSHV